MMKTNEETLSQVVNSLNDKGYKEQLRIENEQIQAISSGKIYSPDALKIVKRYRFDGMTNPGDESTLYAIEDGNDLKATLVVSGDVHAEKELIKKIPSA